MSAAASHEGPARLRLRVRGAVQGVGFRPFVQGLAARYDVSGFVLNDAEGVLAEIEGTALDRFIATLTRDPPVLARIASLDVTPLPLQGSRGFSIRPSAETSAGSACVVPDAATCRACLDEIFDPASRFFLYPFVTCTQCGPRFSILRRLPYDRPQTAMAAFGFCGACAADYADPANRRFHAETIACALCGPRLSHGMPEIAAALRQGRIVALKAIGGFTLFCDAANEAAVQRLRGRKQRPDKPFAVMVANLASVEPVAAASAAERALLSHAARPIVLLRARPGLAPALSRIGVMLPSAPLHHLLFHALSGAPAAPGCYNAPQPIALVATSANAPGQPLIIDDAEARQALSGIADLVVTHDRAIVERVDDSVAMVIAGGPALLRRARGFVPEPIDLGEDGPVVLAVGAHLKATLCITRGREAFVSQHIGDLDTAQTMRFHAETTQRMLHLLDVKPVLVACDLHPDYRSTRLAEATGLPVARFQHHAAHIATVAAEHHLKGEVLGVALDGHGYGEGGGAWGGELMLLQGAEWRRLGHLRPLPLPGGDRAAREPWRMGVAALTVLGLGAEAGTRFPGIALAGPLASLIRADATGPMTSSLGRLFDAAAALLGICMVQSHEGQAAMRLEALVCIPQELSGGFVLREGILDFRPLLAALLRPSLSPSEGASLFHGTVIAGIAAWIGAAAAETSRGEVALGGGCLTNAVLAEGLDVALRARGLKACFARAVPANDGGLSLGQAAMARAHLRDGATMPDTLRS